MGFVGNYISFGGGMCHAHQDYLERIGKIARINTEKPGALAPIPAPHIPGRLTSC